MMAAETGYNQVIQREKIKLTVYTKFAFTSVNCKGMILKRGKSWFRAWFSKACKCVLHRSRLKFIPFQCSPHTCRCLWK